MVYAKIGADVPGIHGPYLHMIGFADIWNVYHFKELDAHLVTVWCL